MLALLTTLMAAPIGISVAETDDGYVASAIADAVERTIERDFRRGAVRIPSDVARARSEMGVGDVVLLRVFAGVTQHLVIAEGLPISLPCPVDELPIAWRHRVLVILTRHAWPLFSPVRP